MSKIAQTILDIITMILTGCVTTKKVKFGDGSTGYEISCPRGFSQCRNKAAWICSGYHYKSGKYKELTIEEYTGAIVPIGGTLVAGRERRLNIICIK